MCLAFFLHGEGGGGLGALQRWGLDAHAQGGAWSTCTRWLLMHIHADCASHEVVHTETVRCFMCLAFFLHGGGGGGLGALQRWGLDAHAQGGAWSHAQARWLLMHIHALCAWHEVVHTETVLLLHVSCFLSPWRGGRRPWSLAKVGP